MRFPELATAASMLVEDGNPVTCGGSAFTSEETAHRTKKHSTMTKGMVCMHNSGRLRGRDKLLSLALTWEPNLDRMSMPAKPAATILCSDISLSPSVIFSVTNPSREYKRRREKKHKTTSSSSCQEWRLSLGLSRLTTLIR